MKYYYDIFTTIEEDFFTNLEPLANDPDYQVIFTGHSLGWSHCLFGFFLLY